jgi:hypothetical protein
MMHSQITEEDVRSGESRCKITVEKAEGGAVKFRFVISDEKQNFPYLFDVALGDVIIIGNGGISAGGSRTLSYERKEGRIICDFTVDKKSLDDPFLSFIFSPS